jgi:hypothetical protein
MQATAANIEAAGRAICAWCDGDLGERPEVQGVTHGICEQCKAALVGEAGLEEFRAKKIGVNILCFKNGKLDAVLEKAERLTDEQLKKCMEHQRAIGREVVFELVD